MSAEAIFSGILPYRFAHRHGVLLVPDGEDGAHLAVREDCPVLALLEALRVAGGDLPVRSLEPEQFATVISNLYGRVGMEDDIDVASPGESLEELLDGAGHQDDLLDNSDDAPVARLINGMIAEAVRAGASDIHLEPFEDRTQVRFRLDGVMRERASLPRRIASFLTSRVKVMARLDIAERRLPQDGRVSLSLGGRTLDLRVSVLPAHHGERVVMRILDQGGARLELSALGMSEPVLTGLRTVLSAPNGIILVTGPTGAGKTTTLYAALGALNDRTRNILTVEDPVEYGLDGVGQTQINPRAGLDFAAGLRAILRQDPDIVMIGEIRDAETARIAVQASLTGHLVLSTVHTNSAAAALTRLRDFGIESFLLASGIRAVLAQRLARRLCRHCRFSYPAEEADLFLLERDSGSELTLWRAEGCQACAHTGHAGRIGLYELILPDANLRRMIHDAVSQDKIEAYAFAGGGRLREQAVEAVLAGEVSMAEMMRIIGAGDTDGNGGV